MMTDATIAVANDDGVSAATLAAFEQARQKIGRAPQGVDASRLRRLLVARVTRGKRFLLALGRAPSLIADNPQIGHGFPEPFGFRVEQGDEIGRTSCRGRVCQYV